MISNGGSLAKESPYNWKSPAAGNGGSLCAPRSWRIPGGTLRKPGTVDKYELERDRFEFVTGCWK